jgi:hypothetical protein
MILVSEPLLDDFLSKIDKRINAMQNNTET